MFQNASFNIVGMADVECVVCAPKNADKRHDVTTMPSSMRWGQSRDLRGCGSNGALRLALDLPLAQGILRGGWPAMNEPCGSPKAGCKVSRMEAAGVELEIRGIGNFLMARDFWRELLDVAVLAAARG